MISDSARGQPLPQGTASGSPAIPEELRVHEMLVSPFDVWRRGKRLHAIEAAQRTLRQGVASDVSYLTDGTHLNTNATTAVNSDEVTPAKFYGTRNRLRHLRERVLIDHTTILKEFSAIGACPIPPTLLAHADKEDGFLKQTVSFQASKPPSRADAVALAKILQYAHRAVDQAYAMHSTGTSSSTALRSVLPEPKLPDAVATHALLSMEDRCILEHLAVVDIGFAELIRQVKIHCAERGALLNHVRETLFGYLGDFLGTEQVREDRVAAKERQAAEVEQQFEDTRQALQEANKTITSLEAEVRRMDTLHKYTIAKHIRDKQRLNRKHQRKSLAPGGTTATGATLEQNHHDDTEQAKSEEDSCEEDSSDDSFGDTLGSMVRMKREMEPKMRRESMAKPILVPSQFPHVRDRQRVRAAEKCDVAVMTDPVFFRSKPAPEPPKPVVTAPLHSTESAGEASAVFNRAPRRERMGSVMLAKSVTHNYTQTEAMQVLPPSAPIQLNPTFAAFAGDGNQTQAAGPEGASLEEPSGIFRTRSSSIVNSSAQVSRVATEEARKRITLAANKVRTLRASCTNVEIQATPTIASTGVQKGEQLKSTATQTSVLLQMHLSGAMQATSSSNPETPMMNNPLSTPTTQSQSNGDGSAKSVQSSTMAALEGNGGSNTLTPQTASLSTPLLGTPSGKRDASVGTKIAVLDEMTQTEQGLLSTPVSSNPPVSPGAKALSGPGKRLAGLVKPLLDSDLSTMQSSFQNPLSTVAASTAKSSDRSQTGPKVRNLRWMTTSAMEVHFTAIKDKFGTSTSADVTALLLKHFRGKYGFDKVAEGYVADFQATLKTLICPLDDANTGGSKEVPLCMGLYRQDSGVSIVLHRRLFAFVQFTKLCAIAQMSADDAFNNRSYQYYLYILETLRSRGGKGFVKDVNDDVFVAVAPRQALVAIEVALQDRLPRELLELYLLSIQGAMIRVAEHLQKFPQTHVPEALLHMWFPRGHPALASLNVSPFLLELSDASLTEWKVPQQFVAMPQNVTWDMDLLLELLVRSYDKHVRMLIHEARRLRSDGSEHEDEHLRLGSPEVGPSGSPSTQ